MQWHRYTYVPYSTSIPLGPYAQPGGQSRLQIRTVQDIWVDNFKKVSSDQVLQPSTSMNACIEPVGTILTEIT